MMDIAKREIYEMKKEISRVEKQNNGHGGFFDIQAKIVGAIPDLNSSGEDNSSELLLESAALPRFTSNNQTPPIRNTVTSVEPSTEV